MRGVWAPNQSPAEMYDDPQVIANGFLRETKYPTTPLTVPIPPKPGRGGDESDYGDGMRGGVGAFGGPGE